MNTLIIIAIIAAWAYVSAFKAGRARGREDNVARAVSSLLKRH